MKIRVRYFAVLRERTGAREDEFELPEGASVEDLFTAMAARHPNTAALRPALRAALNQEFVPYSSTLSDGDECAFIPPVSGGSGAILLTENPLDPQAIREFVTSPSHGAIVSFEGTVRDHRDGDSVQTLEYEVYEEMARAKLAEVAHRVENEHGVRVAIHHRYGLMEVGETAVLIAVGAAHRAEAFDGCRAVIEALKVEVPIWKKETGPDGAVWVGLGP